MKKNIGQYLMLLLFLVVFPLISWIYLKQGFNYRKEALDKLQNHGTITPYQLVEAGGDTFNLQDYRGKVVLASFFRLEQGETAPLYGDRLRRLHAQFGERQEVLFLQHILQAEDAATRISTFRDRYALNDDSGSEVVFALPDASRAHSLMQDIYRMPDSDAMVGQSSYYFALADTAHTIRRYYDVRQDSAMQELVEHLAIVIPPVKERDLVFKREKEK